MSTLYEWASGMEVIECWIHDFYARVRDDELLAPLFEDLPEDHPRFIAEFMAEVLGRSEGYSLQGGRHPHAVGDHEGINLSNQQRQRWVHLLFESADAVGVPDDPEFRSVIVAYVEWGSRWAATNAQPGIEVDPDAPVPKGG